MRWLKLSGVAVLTAATLSGCTAVMEDTYDAVRQAFRSVPDATLSAEEIAEFPYTALYMREGKDPRAILVLGFVDQVAQVPRYQFVSRRGQTISLEYGRIVSTTGLGVEVSYVADRSQDPLRCIAGADLTAVQSGNSGCELSWERQVDIREQGRESVETVRSEFKPGEFVDMTFPDEQTRTVLHIKEQGRFMQSGKRFTNEYWLEHDGHVAMTTQRITPSHPAVRLTQIKWVGRD